MRPLWIAGRAGAWFAGRLPLIGRRLPILCFAASVVLSATVASADPIRIVTSGGFITGGEDTGFNLSGINFTMSVSPGLGPIVTCEPCIPGTMLNLSARLNVHDWPAGRATVDGQTYNSVFFSGSFNLNAGSVIVPAMEPGSSQPDGQGLSDTLFTTFTFTGALAGFASSTLAGAPLFVTELAGGGTGQARVRFQNLSEASGVTVYEVAYDYFPGIAPTPEPGSLMLFGSGMAWIAARFRKRRH